MPLKKTIFLCHRLIDEVHVDEIITPGDLFFCNSTNRFEFEVNFTKRPRVSDAKDSQKLPVQRFFRLRIHHVEVKLGYTSFLSNGYRYYKLH